MEKDMEYWAKSYRNLSDIEKGEIEGLAEGTLYPRWDQERPLDLWKLENQSWIHIENLGLVVDDNKLHVPKDFLSEIPEDADEEVVKLVKEFIHEYLALAIEGLKGNLPENSQPEDLMTSSSLKDFVIGLVKRRGAGDIDYFK